MASVKLTGVYKYYEKNPKPSVSDFNLEIQDKEFVVFVGPSGCGKSTTLRMVAGLEEISEGEIAIDDKVVNDVEPKDRDIAMVFQNYALYPHMSVYENLAFGLRLSKIPDVKKDRKGNPILDKEGKQIPVLRHYTKKEIDAKVKEAAAILEIGDYLKRKPKALSGGQRQRVAIGRAIVRNPKVFLMDEPLSNLDAKLRNQMRSELILLRKRINTTFIYVTHDQTEAMTLGDRIVIMKDGVIQQVGTPSEVFDRPANLFVAGFIGTPQMNFFNGKLQKTAKGYVAQIGENTVALGKKLSDALSAAAVEEKEIVLGIRPEHMALTKKSDSNCFEGDIVVSEMMGSEFYLHVQSGENKIVLRIPVLGLSAQERETIANNGKVQFSMNLSAIHLFDKESGLNLLH